MPSIVLDMYNPACYHISRMKTDINNIGNDNKPSDVYILHFKDTYWGKAKHYVGYTTIGAENRIEVHRSGRGSKLVNYALNKLGIDFEVGMIMHFDTRVIARMCELKFKKEKNLSRHCEICSKEKHGE